MKRPVNKPNCPKCGANLGYSEHVINFCHICRYPQHLYAKEELEKGNIGEKWVSPKYDED